MKPIKPTRPYPKGPKPKTGWPKGDWDLMKYEKRPEQIEAWPIKVVHPADKFNGQDFDLEDGKRVHMSTDDVVRSGVNPNVGDYYIKQPQGAATLMSKIPFEGKWRALEG